MEIDVLQARKAALLARLSTAEEPAREVRAPASLAAAFGGGGQTKRSPETDDCQNARTVCSIGTQPFRPAVYGVKAPL